MIKIEVQSTRAVIRFQEPLTVGLRGAKVSFAFGQDWENLSKTAVFRQADRTVSVAAEPETVIPWEVLTMPGVPVQIGVYGVDSTGAVAIPTVWAVTQPVRPGTDPEGDPALEPTPGLWEQMQGKLTELEAALENTQAPVYTVTVRKNEDGSYWADKSPEDRADAYLAGKMLMCHWREYNLLLPLSHTSGRRTFVFRTVKDGSEYCVEMTEDIQCTRKALETEAPVQSVNGQTGDVVLPTPLKVTVSQGTEGDYFADTDPDFIQEALDHNRTLVCCWQEKNVMLPLTSFRQGGPYSFTAVTGKQEYSVTIYDTENIACTVTKLSPEAVLYTPQELTPEQQTQARVNIGADESVLLDFTVEEEVLEIFLPLDEHKEDINNSTEIMLYAQLQMPTADEAAALGTIGADVGYLKNQSTGSFIDCSALLRNDQILPTNSITYIKFVTVTSHIHKSPNAFSAGWGPMGYITKVIYKANQSPTVVTGQVANRFIPTDKNAVLKIAASHPIGMGSRFKLAIRR